MNKENIPYYIGFVVMGIFTLFIISLMIHFQIRSSETYKICDDFDMEYKYGDKEAFDYCIDKEGMAYPIDITCDGSFNVKCEVKFITIIKN